MLLVSVYLHQLPACAAECALPALEPLDDGEDRLRSQPIGRKWHISMIIIVGKYLRICLHLLAARCCGGVAPLAHVVSYALWADGVVWPSDINYQYDLFGSSMVRLI